MTVVAVIPALNEAKNIKSVVRGAVKSVDAVVVADHGSADGTATIARSAGADVCLTLSIGLGNNITHGLSYAIAKYHPDIIVLLDGDGQHDPADISKLVYPISMDCADVCIGDRQSQMPDYRLFGNDILKWMFNLGSRNPVADPMIGFWAFKLSALTLPTNTAWGAYIEMLTKFKKNRQRILSVPVNSIYHNGKSKHYSSAFWLGSCFAWNIFKYKVIA